MTQTMKAWFAVPGPEGAVFELRESPVPAAGPGQVVVAVRAAGTNRGELIRGAALRSGAAAAPARAGTEFAGEIAALGEGVSGWRAGDRVMGRSVGSYAHFVAASPRALMRIPDGMSWAEAAAIPNVFVTAHDALVTNAAARAGESVMVTAGPSGVGTAAIQIAKLHGARVIATAGSDDKLARARALGADVVINYTTADFAAECRTLTGKRGVDAVIEHVGGDVFARSIRAVRNGGRIVTCGATAGFHPDIDLRHIFFRQVEVLGSTMGSKADLLAVLSHVAAGRLEPVVHQVLPLARAADAHRLLESRAAFGKVVLEP
jgi:NADPH:quinone reductase-like Zn-dependent oxidoreductase